MNEEQAVLDFFSLEENFPLALIAAEHLDGIRLEHNNRFWRALHKSLAAWLIQLALPWNSALTEDRNNADALVGIHFEPHAAQRSFLRPFMEQQLMGDSFRIYYGLMWDSDPEPAQKILPAVETLRSSLNAAGFKQSDSFLAWQWSPWHPRRKDFLLRFSNKQGELLNETMQPWHALLLKYGEELRLANIALNEAPRSATITLDQLHSRTKR